MNRRRFLAYGAIGVSAAAYPVCVFLTKPSPARSTESFVYVITSRCLRDGACTDVCPVDAMCRGEKQFYIDPDACIACGACVTECPVDAIYATNDIPPEHAAAVAENRRMCKGA